MALKGNLETVSLPDVFQILARQGQAGLLQIFSPDGTRYVELERGKICAVSGAGAGILLGDLLIHHTFLTPENLEKALNMQRTRNVKLGQILVDNKFCTMAQIEEAVRFQVQEEICDLFMIKSAEFEFFAGTELDEKLALGGKFVKLQINPDSVLLEAARRMDEWSSIETKIPSGATLFAVTELGRDYYQSADRNTQIIMTLINEVRTFESIVAKSCMGRFRTGATISSMLDTGAIQHLAFELYPQIADKHFHDGRFKEARLIYRYAIDYIQDPVVRETMFKNLQLVELRLQELESGGVEIQPSEILRAPSLPGNKITGRTMVLAAILLIVLVVGGGLGVGWLLTRAPSDESLDDSEYDSQRVAFEKAFGEKQWIPAKQILAQMAPKKEANKQAHTGFQDTFLLTVSEEAKAGLAELKAIDPDKSFADAHRYIDTGRALVKKYPETLALKEAVIRDIKALDFSLDGMQKKLLNRESAALLESIQQDIATRPTESTLAAMEAARKKGNVTPVVQEKFHQIEAEIALLRQAQAASLTRYTAARKDNRVMEALAEAKFLMTLQEACHYGPTPEVQQLLGEDSPQAIKPAEANLHAARADYEKIFARIPADPKQAAADLDRLLKQYPGTLEKGRIGKILEAIAAYGQ